VRYYNNNICTTNTPLVRRPMSLNPNLQSKSCLRRYFRRFSQPKVGYCLLTKKCFFHFYAFLTPYSSSENFTTENHFHTFFALNRWKKNENNESSDSEENDCENFNSLNFIEMLKQNDSCDCKKNVVI